MKFHCVADEDTVRGFQPAGISGSITDSGPDAAAKVEAAAAQPDCAIIILTERVADSIRPLVEQIRFERERPLIVEIAGPESVASGHKHLRQLVQEAVGLHINSEKRT